MSLIGHNIRTSEHQNISKTTYFAMLLVVILLYFFPFNNLKCITFIILYLISYNTM